MYIATYRPFAACPSAPINNVISSKCTFFASIMADIPMERSIVAREIHQVTG